MFFHRGTVKGYYYIICTETCTMHIFFLISSWDHSPSQNAVVTNRIRLEAGWPGPKGNIHFLWRICKGLREERRKWQKKSLHFEKTKTIHNNTWRCLFVRIQWVTIGYETILWMLSTTRRSHTAIWPSLCINQPTKVFFSWLLGHFNSSTVHSQCFVRHHLTSQDFHVYTIYQTTQTERCQ